MDAVYSSARLDAPVADAAAALDLLITERRGRAEVAVDGGSLWFSASDALFTLKGRRFRAIVCVGQFWRVPVEIELQPWSATRSELVLRLAGDRVPFPARRYFAVSSTAVRKLGEQIERRVRLCLDAAA